MEEAVELTFKILLKTYKTTAKSHKHNQIDDSQTGIKLDLDEHEKQALINYFLGCCLDLKQTNSQIFN
jgi:hypothetical protein